MRIGLDFDNTIIRYDEVFLVAAIERGLVHSEFRGNKQAVRDAIRLLPDGEISWQKLQGHVYGKGILRATAFDGVGDFLRKAGAVKAEVRIVSHKTEYGHYDPERVNLRAAAMDWMEVQGFFTADGFGLDRADIHFAATRAEKLTRIGDLRCDVFVDDLEEVLEDPHFPAGIRRILLSDQAKQDGRPYRVCESWLCIEQAVFQ